MASTFLEELEKCEDEVEAVEVVVPDGQEVYNKITKGRSESRVTQKKRKVSINHTKKYIETESCKVGEESRKVGEESGKPEEKLEMQKKDRTQDRNLSSDKTLSFQ